MKLQLLLTGNELMSGHTIDTNSAMIAELLGNAGFSIAKKVTIGDDFTALLAEIRALADSGDVLIINGGLGPTVDDLTASVLATVAGVELEQNPDALQHLQHWCKQRRSQLNDANLKQAMLPTGSTIIPNPIGSAVGFSLEYNDCLIICTPGVPSELQAMMEQSIINLLLHRFPDHQPKKTLRFQTFGLGESTIQQKIINQMPHWPQSVELGFRAGLPQLELKLTVSDSEQQTELQHCQQALQQLLGDYIIGSDDQTLAGAVFELLQQQGKLITVAESCTGGLIAACITEVAGTSAVFEAGFVTYSNAMKSSLLGVSVDTLASYGAVSEPVVLAMAEGALERSGADYVIAVSGVAGPSGGSPDKPVGTVWIAWGSARQLQAHCFHFNGSRRRVQTMAAATGLDLIRRQLLGIKEEPLYQQRLASR